MTRKEKLEKVRSFAVYYGRDGLNKLVDFDMVIVEPAAQSPISLSELKKRGILALAYVSAVEVNKSFVENGLLRSEDLLTVRGQPLENSQYGNYLADLRSKNWCLLLWDKIGNLLLHDGYDGIFIDTLGDLEWEIIPKTCRENMYLAAAEFIMSVRDAFPGHLIVQNNGVNEICKFTAELIDSLCWENPSSGSLRHWMRNRQVMKQLHRMSKQHGFRVLLLFEGRRTRSVILGFNKRSWPEYFATKGYLNI